MPNDNPQTTPELAKKIAESVSCFITNQAIVFMEQHDKAVRKAALEECWQIAMGWDMGAPIADDIHTLVEREKL